VIIITALYDITLLGEAYKSHFSVVLRFRFCVAPAFCRATISTLTGNCDFDRGIEVIARNCHSCDSVRHNRTRAIEPARNKRATIARACC